MILSPATIKYFLQGVAVGWGVFAVGALLVQMFRPLYFDYLLPTWATFLVAALSALLAAQIKE